MAQNLNANTEDEKLLKTQVQSVFIAFDISINDEMREDPTEIIEEIIQTIENITTNVRNTKSKDGAVISAQNEAAQEESSYDNSSSKPVTLPSNARNEKLKDEKVKGEKAKAEIVIFTDNNKETKQEQAADEVSSRKISTAPAPQIPINASEEKPQTGHIFISYCHQNTTRAMQIRDLLKERGLPIWIDAEAIRGNSVEAMVNGLNYARLVIICMSDGYRQSDFCKREAEYTVLKKKTYQPVIMQEGFHMENDWLCFMVGLQNWIDLGSDLLFDANKSQFVDHVQHLFSTSKEINLSPSSAAKSHTEGTNIASEVKKWKTPDVLKWLDKEQLEDAKEMYCTLIHYTK